MHRDGLQERGAALVTVLLFMVIVLILITSVLAVTGNEIRISGLHKDSVRALELAQSGLQEGVRRIESGRPFFIGDQGTTECPSGFPPSVALSTGESLDVGVCQITSGAGYSVYEVQADARVGVAVRKLSVTVRVLVNNVPPEIVLSRDFGQSGSAGVDEGDIYTETFTQYDEPPASPQRSYAGWFIQNLNLSGDPKCYAWPCTFATNLYPGHRRMLNESDPAISDIGTCTTTIPAGGIRADDPTQTAGDGTTPQCGSDTDAELATYILDSVDSDQTGGADFTKQLVTTGATASTITFSIAARPGGPGTAAEEESYAFTTAGIPGTSGRGGNYAVVVKVNSISGGGSAVSLLVRADRVPSSGAPTNSPSFSIEQTLSDNTTYVFPLYGVALGTWAAGDRLRIVYKFKNTATSAKTVTLEAGTSGEYVAAPFGAVQATLPYKYVAEAIPDETGATVTRYFKTVSFEDWFDAYYEFIESGSGCVGWCKKTALQNNPQFTAIPTFPSDSYLQTLINQAGTNSATGGGVFNGSEVNFGCPPVGSPDPHTPGCNGSTGDYRFVALTDGDYTINGNINGFGTIVVTGDLTINGTFTYMGTIFVKGGVTLGSGNVTIRGGLVTEQTTIMSGNITVNTGDDQGNITVSNDVTVTIGAMWER